MTLNVALIEPEIPQNTGNIARTCVVTGSVLHIVKPMGFSLSERHIRRAGLDYWKYLQLHIYENIDELWEKYPNAAFWFFSSKAQRRFDQADYANDCFLVFGNETAGLKPEVTDGREEQRVRIPMVEGQRCLNLSNAVGVAVYEAKRQQGYAGLR